MKSALIFLAALTAAGWAALAVPETASACTMVPGSGYSDGWSCDMPTWGAARENGSIRTGQSPTRGPVAQPGVPAQSPSSNAAPHGTTLDSRTPPKPSAPRAKTG